MYPKERFVAKITCWICETLTLYNLIVFLIKLSVSVISLGSDLVVYGLEMIGTLLAHLIEDFQNILVPLYLAIALQCIVMIIRYIQRKANPLPDSFPQQNSGARPVPGQD